MHREDQFTPHLIVSDGLAALEFYKEVFGAEEGDLMMAPDGKRLMHGEFILDGHKVFVSDEFDLSEGGTCKSPETLGGTCVRVTLHVACSCRCRTCSGARATERLSIRSVTSGASTNS